MTNRVPVLHYLSLADHQHVLDAVVQAERRTCETPFSVNPNALDDLFTPAGISPDMWKAHVLERYKIDLAAPDRQTFLDLYPTYTEGFLASEFRKMTENAEYWQMDLEEQAVSMWEIEDGVEPLVDPSQMWEILENTQGTGLPFVCFMADPDDIRKAVSDDYEITLSPGTPGEGGVMFGLHDPANGRGWFALATGSLTIRPSIEGRMCVNDEEVLDLFGMEGAGLPQVDMLLADGPPLLVSSRSEETYRPAPPKVDLSSLPAAFVPGV